MVHTGLNERNVRFTLHVREMLDMVIEQGIMVDLSQVSEIVRHASRIYWGTNNLPVVNVPLDEEHILRVVFVD